MKSKFNPTQHIMRNSLILIFYLLFGNVISAQTKPLPLNLMLFTFERADLLFGIDLLRSDNPTLVFSRSEVLGKLQRSKFPFIKQHSSDLSDLFDPEYLPSKQSDSAIVGEFILDNKIGIYFSSFVYGSTLNTLKFDQKARLRYVAEHYGLDFMKDAYRKLGNAKYQTIAIRVLFSSRNFSDSDALYNTDRESIVICLDVFELKRFAENLITEDEAMAKMKVYYSTDKTKGYRKTALK